MKKLLVFLLMALVISCKTDKKQASSETTASKNEMDPELKESVARGGKIYNNFCASCHLTGGEGIEGVFPPVNGSNWLTEKRKEAIRAVKHGLQGPITVNEVTYDNFMPDLGLNDQEVADVMNYIFNSWENDIEESVSVQEVESITK